MKNYLIILSILTIVGCSSDFDSSKGNSEAKKLSEYGNIKESLIDSLKVISGDNQVFFVDAAKSNTVIGKDGTIIVIPANSIVAASGDAIEGKVKFELKENFKISDYITSNLQTKSNESLLESKGMIFFNAKDSLGNNLTISNGNSIRIEIPQKDLKNDPKIFLGERDDEGNINWSTEEEPSKSLIAYPIHILSKNRFPTECSDFYGITTDTTDRWANYIGNIEDYEGTFLAAKEFKQRYDGYCARGMVRTYIDNLDKNLWQADSAMVSYLIQDSIKRIAFWSRPPKGINGAEPTKEQWESHNKYLENRKKSCNRAINWFRDFQSLGLTKVDSSIIADTAALNNINRAYIAYNAMDFGWVNVDFFYKSDSTAKPVELSVKTNVSAEVVSLIFKERNIIISANNYSKPTLYPITKGNGIYNRLPIGEKAIIVGLSINANNEVLFATKEITIGDSDIETLELVVTSGEDVKKGLELLNK